MLKNPVPGPEVKGRANQKFKGNGESFKRNDSDMKLKHKGSKFKRITVSLKICLEQGYAVDVYRSL